MPRLHAHGGAADADVADLGGVDQAVGRDQCAVECNLGRGRCVGHKTGVQNDAVGLAVVVASATVADEQADLVDAAVFVGVDEAGAGLAGVVPGKGPDHLHLLHRVEAELVIGVVEAFRHPQVDAVDLAHMAVDDLG